MQNNKFQQKQKNAETNKEEKGAKEKMKKTKTFKSIETLEREREREQYLRKIGFICDAKSISYNNKIARETNCRRSEYRRKKWVDYKKHEIKSAV